MIEAATLNQTTRDRWIDDSNDSRRSVETQLSHQRNVIPKVHARVV